jgi:hypothetical protein
VQPIRFLVLCLLLASRAFIAAEDDFGSAFRPTFTFSETYRESVRYSATEDDFLDQTTSNLSFTARVSMAGVDLGAITNEESLLVDVGNLSLDLILGEGTRSVVDGMNVVRWQLDGTDPDTGDDVRNACTVTLRYNATELIVQLTSSNVPDDFNIIAPDEAGSPGKVQGSAITFNFSVGPYFLDERTCYVNGTSDLYDIVVHGEEFTDLADVSLTGEFDFEKPTVRITDPQADATVDSTPIEVSGTITDNYDPVAVEVSLNSGPFNSAILENNGTWHLGGITPLPGLNSLVARGEDESGNVDVSGIRTFTYVPRSQLTVSAAGNAPGSVSGSFINRLDFHPTQPGGSVQAELVIGNEYVLNANPSAEALFDHWTSSATSLTLAQATSPRLVFTMTEDLTLTAQFIINPFVSVQGKYAGLFASTTSGSVGLVSGKLSQQGVFSLKAKIGTLTLPMKGQFSRTGHFTGPILVGGVVYTVDLTLNVTGAGSRTITGTVVNGNASFGLAAELSPFQKKSHPVPAPLVGSFNFLLPPNPTVTDPNYPVGLGFGRLLVSVGGSAKFTAKLADGTPVTGGTMLTGENRWLFFSSLYRNAGSIAGWVTIDPSQVDHDLSGTVDWRKPRSVGPAIHAEGFAGQSDLAGARSGRPAPVLSLAGASTSQLTLRSSPSDQAPLDLTIPFTLPRSVRTTVSLPPGSPIQSITCKVQRKTGMISGRLVEHGANRKIQGIVVGSKLNEAGGFVLRNGRSTALSITPILAQ